MPVFLATSDKTACKQAARDTTPRALIWVRPSACGLGHIYRSIKLTEKQVVAMDNIAARTGGADHGSEIVCRPNERLVACY
jgi:hypothetical protein